MADVGASAEVRFLVDADATAIALGSGDVPVLGTPKVVALCEEAAVLAVASELDTRSTSVGIHIALDHVAPTPVGRTVVAYAELTEVDGRTLEFRISVTDGGTVVASGTHVRVVVDRSRFVAKVGGE